MLRRILFILCFVISMPLLICSALLIPITGLIGLFWYVISGDPNDEIIDFIQSPISFCIDLPYKIMGRY